jgi:hypothetical protein
MAGNGRVTLCHRTGQQQWRKNATSTVFSNQYRDHHNLPSVVLHAGLMMSYHACMNPNATELGIRRKSVLMRRTIPLRNKSPLPEGGTASRLRRWIRAVLQTPAPAPVSPRPATPADRTPGAPAPASLDSRERSSWRPFSPRF